MRTVFLGHNFTNGNDYRLCIAHRVCYYGLAVSGVVGQCMVFVGTYRRWLSVVGWLMHGVCWLIPQMAVSGWLMFGVCWYMQQVAVSGVVG